MTTTIDLSARREKTSYTAAVVLTVVALVGLGYGILGGGGTFREISLVVVSLLFLGIAGLQVLVARARSRQTLALVLEPAGLRFDDHGPSTGAAVNWAVGWDELASAAVVRQAWSDSIGTGSRTSVGNPTTPARAHAPGYNPATNGTVVLDLVARQPLETARPALARCRVADAPNGPRYRMGLGQALGLADQLAQGMQGVAPQLFAGVHDEAVPAIAAPQPVWDPTNLASRVL